MSKPTYDDANVMLQLARWSTEMGLYEANTFFWSDDFEADYKASKEKYPRGTPEWNHIGSILMWFESLGALWLNELLHEKLISDWVTVDMAWDRIKGIALGAREESGNPRIYENFEKLDGGWD